MSHRPDLGFRVALADEGIVLRSLAVQRDPENLPHMAVQLLRLGPYLDVGALSQRHIQHPVRPDVQAGAEVVGTIVSRQRAKDHPHLFQPFAVGREYSPCHARAVAALPRLGETPVDRPIRFELRAQHYIEETTLSTGVRPR
jgi:hypothetical protein